MYMADEAEHSGPYSALPTNVEFSDAALVVARLSDGILIHASEGFCSFVGRSREEIVGRRADESGLSGSERAAWILSRPPEAGQAHRYWRTFQTPRGERPAEMIIHRVGDDLLVVTVTELDEATESAEREGVLGSIIDAVPLGVVVYDRERRIVRVNRIVEELGRVRPEHLGQRIMDAFPDVDPAVVASIDRVLDTGEEILNQPATRPDGHHLLLNFFPIRSDGGAVEQVGCVFSDVTDVLAAQQLIMLQQEAIRELSTPILELGGGVLVAPLIGALDPERARLLTERVLSAILTRRGRAVVIDVTGVPVFDTEIANHLHQTAQAARLMGATTILSGLSAESALALASLGAVLDKTTSVATLEDAIAELSTRSTLGVPAR
jgi:PAS domain S-box-containing protein